MFAFSTCWNSDGHIDGEPMIDEIRALGFTNIELSHGIRLSLIEGIEKAMLEDPAIKITSLHNFCPLPVGFIRSAPNIYLLSSENESERQKAIRQTITTMDFATRIGARYVVLHMGKVQMPDVTSDLLKLVELGIDSPKYQKAMQKAVTRREDKGRDAFARCMRSLEVLAPAAQERKITLGIESRYRLEEIPIAQEFAQIFRAFDPSVVGYWHDSGHSHTWHNLGLNDHVRWLEQFSKHIVGSHIHDVAFPDRDHQIPGDGDVPFDQLTALHRPELLKVFEFEPGTPADELKQRLPAFMKALETPAE